MKRARSTLRLQITLMAIASLVLVWATAAYELYRSYHADIHEAEVRTTVQAHVFAEYSRSTLKRINEFILDVRGQWTGDWASFAALIKRRQENIDDLTFQVALIDRDGIMLFSNLAKPSTRTDLSEREHFRVHRDANNADRLFISRPLLGKVSGKWSLQVTRPILRDGVFDGVLVVSVSPDEFAGFAKKLRVADNSAVSVVRDTGEIMARHPANASALGTIVRDRPYLIPDAPISGNYRQFATVDGAERIFGFYRAPEYGMTFVVGEAVSDVLRGFYSHRTQVLAGATAISAVALILFLMLFRSLTALEEVRYQLGEIFELSPDGFVSFDEHYCVSYVSPTFDRLTGLISSDMVGLDESEFARRLSSVCAAKAGMPELPVLRTAQLAHGGQEAGHRHLIELATAGKRVLEVGIRLSQATSVSQILYFRDVTHETEVDRMKSEFLSTAAHELRTPMASIFGFSEVLLAQEYEREERNEFLGIIHRQSSLMISIINELLDLVRIEERRGKDFDITRIDCNELLTDAVTSFKPPEGREAPRLQTLKAPCALRGDRKKLMQAMNNVLSNAYKYSPAGGPIEISLEMPGEDAPHGHIAIRIRDFGIGMTPEQLSRVCERFYRVDASGSIPGTGLGMSIVKEIVELHGGWVKLESCPGQGTSVSLWLPTA